MHIMRSPYARLMRLHQPVGIGLLFWPCGWSAMLAAHDGIPYVPLLMMAFGAMCMRSAGCIINDIVDRDIDAQVERTRTRPLASGEISLSHAILLLAALLGMSLLIAWQMGTEVLWWAALSIPLVATYPWMKRLTWWPQLFLGFTFNWGALLGWVAVRGSLETPAVLLYTGAIFWTLGYDTLYAHQDKHDDARIGVRSTALLLGQDTIRAVRLFYCLALAAWLAAGWQSGAGVFYFAGLIVVQQLLFRQTCDVDLDDPASCRAQFVANVRVGGAFFIACVLSRW